MLELEFISTLLRSVESDAEMLDKIQLAATVMLSTALGENLIRIPVKYKPLLVQESGVRLIHGYFNGLTRFQMTQEEAARACVIEEFEYCQSLFKRLICDKYA